MQLSLLEWGGVEERAGLEHVIEMYALSRREGEVARGVSLGLTNNEIADQMHVTEKTVKFHLTNIFRKCKVSNRVKLALMIRGV